MEAVYRKVLELADPDGVLNASPADLQKLADLPTSGPVYSALRVLDEAGALHYVSAHRQAIHLTLLASPAEVTKALGTAHRREDLFTLRALWKCSGGQTLYAGASLSRKALEALPGGAARVLAALARMQKDRILTWRDEPLGIRLGREYIAVEDLPVAWGRLEARRNLQLAKLASVERYATARGCRRRSLLAYFEDRSPTTRCGGCDFCGRAEAA